MSESEERDPEGGLNQKEQTIRVCVCVNLILGFCV